MHIKYTISKTSLKKVMKIKIVLTCKNIFFIKRKIRYCLRVYKVVSKPTSKCTLGYFSYCYFSK